MSVSAVHAAISICLSFLNRYQYFNGQYLATLAVWRLR
jgi:hypothetical protein